MTSQSGVSFGWRTPLVVIFAGCLISVLGFGLRASFGLFLEPMTVANGWDRETYAIAIAIQNLLWGLGVPVAGALADKFGPVKVIALGGVMYGLGIFGMAHAEGPMSLHLSAGLLTGMGVAFTSFSLALAAIARVVGPEKRSLAMGLGTASGSFGQVLFSPLTLGFIVHFGWFGALYTLAAICLAFLPLAWLLPNITAENTSETHDQTLREAVREALGNRSFVLLTTGFFVCGFHVAFIIVHFPAYTKDIGLPVEAGAVALALIGGFNIIGAFTSGIAGQHFSKKWALSFLYLFRGLAIALMLIAPATELTIYIFASALGLLWLSTVPLTTSLVAQIFGIQYLGTLFGIIFFSHQIGSFLGVWLGGWAYDNLGTYDPVWWLGAGLGLIAAVVHMPINETPLPRGARTPQPVTASAERPSASPGGLAQYYPELAIGLGICLLIGSLSGLFLRP